METQSNHAVEINFDLIIFSLLLAAMVTFFGFVYQYTETQTKIQTNGPALSVSHSESLLEEQDQSVYKGRKDYRTSLGDKADVKLSGSSVDIVSSDNETLPGASVFAEMQNLPNTIEKININGVSFCNDQSKSDQKTIDGKTNISYYVTAGNFEDLMTVSHIDASKTYQKDYKLDSYGNIIQITYKTI